MYGKMRRPCGSAPATRSFPGWGPSPRLNRSTRQGATGPGRTECQNIAWDSGFRWVAGRDCLVKARGIASSRGPRRPVGGRAHDELPGVVDRLAVDPDDAVPQAHDHGLAVVDTYHQSRCIVGYDQPAGPLAQLAEQRTFNPWVLGSIPRRPTKPLVGAVSGAEPERDRWILLGSAPSDPSHVPGVVAVCWTATTGAAHLTPCDPARTLCSGCPDFAHSGSANRDQQGGECSRDQGGPEGDHGVPGSPPQDDQRGADQTTVEQAEDGAGQ